MTRIIAGSAKGRVLKVPDTGTRPSSDRLRESLFSTLESWLATQEREWPEVLFIDLFSGSGSIALEAKSRGAGEVIAVDSRQICVAIIKANAAKSGLSCQIQRADAYQWLWSTQFSIVFADPPYDHSDDRVQELCARLADNLPPEGDRLIVCERGSRSPDPFLTTLRNDVVKSWHRRYGDSVLWYLHLQRRHS